ncbi:MAG: MATE family efflux transporter [Treponema sp.]|nr:MATE family efflux transporter [Treponema sp.]MCL2272923.1 MATE family efflux transporter [Treponema sp.]
MTTINAETAIRSSPLDTPVTLTPVNWNNRKLFGLLWPLIIEQLLVVTMGIADMIMVSSVGEHAVSGISLVESINFLIITILIGITTGGSVVTSQYIGRNDRENAGSSAKQLIYIGVFISFFLVVFTLIFHRPMLRFIYGNISADVMQSAATYFFFTALSYPFLSLHFSAAALFRSMGNSAITMKAAILMNIVKIGANAFFIYGLKMGVAGAGISTIIGRFSAACMLLFFLTGSRKNIIDLRGITKIKPEWTMIKRILNIGIPSCLESSMFQVGKILVTRIFTVFGTAAIAANAVSSTINSLAFMPGSGYGIGLLIIAGQFMGAGNYSEAKRYTKKILKLAYLTYFLININIWIFMNPIISIFNLSSESHVMCVTFLRIHCITSALFWCLSFVLPNALKAAGDARYVMIVAVCTMWAVRVCSAFVLAFPLGLGPVAVWYAMGADFLFRGIFFTIRWTSGRWMEKRVI